MSDDYIKRIREAYAYLQWDVPRLTEEIDKLSKELMELSPSTEEWERKISWRLYLCLRRSKLELQ